MLPTSSVVKCQVKCPYDHNKFQTKNVSPNITIAMFSIKSFWIKLSILQYFE